MPETPTRKDAQRSRRAILAAARELFAAGEDASFAEIAHAAGVGQATVYRHFEDRQELLLAVAEQTLGEIESELDAEQAAEPPPLEDLLSRVVAEQVRGRGLGAAIRSGEIGEERVRLLAGSVLELFRPSFEAARESGRLRADLELADVELLLAMVDGAIASLADPVERRAVAERAVSLGLRGMLAGSERG